jgi:hypothetical protein
MHTHRHTLVATPALNHGAIAAGVAVLDVAQQLAALKHRIALPTALVMHGPNTIPQPVLVLASEHQASVVELLHVAAADAAALHTPLACLYQRATADDAVGRKVFAYAPAARVTRHSRA